MKRISISLLVLLTLAATIAPVWVVRAGGYTGIPTFSITAVVKDQTVTIQAYNFPAGDSFVVRMGPYGTLGIGGYYLTTVDSGGGGSFVDTYDIPSGLAGSQRIAIRLESPSSGFYAYNWFWNNTAPGGSSPAPTGVPGYSGYPVFSIKAVERGKTVTITGSNFPPNDNFVVTMNTYGTLGVGGYEVTTTNSGSGGSLVATYNIPSALTGLDRIAIRLQSPTSGLFAYNWFWNNTYPGNPITPEPTKAPVPTVTPGPVYSGYPSFSITSVERNKSVTIKGKNFPSNDAFVVTMNTYGTLGIGGYNVTTTNTGAGGTIVITYDIPSGLYNLDRIAIRLQSSTSGYFAYNWFWNHSTK